MTQDPELYRELNIKVREKCPDIIINDTAACGRIKMGDSEFSPQLLASVYAEPEIASLDITNYCSLAVMKKREPPLFGRDETIVREMTYTITQTEVEYAIGLMKERRLSRSLNVLKWGTCTI